MRNSITFTRVVTREARFRHSRAIARLNAAEPYEVTFNISPVREALVTLSR